EGGAAGALMAFLATYAVFGDSRLLERAERCVLRLIAMQLQSGHDRGAWPAGHDSRPRPGFAHGTAGIACALSRWLAYRPDQSVQAALSAAWDFERRVFVEHHGAWPAIRDDGGATTMTAICHGPAGIALAGAFVQRILGADVEAEIATA